MIDPPSWYSEKLTRSGSGRFASSTSDRPAVLSGSSGATVAAIPLIAMSYLGLSIPKAMETRARLIAENEKLAAMEAHLDRAWIEKLPEGTFLIVPNGTETLWTCGAPPLPCIRLEE